MRGLAFRYPPHDSCTLQLCLRHGQSTPCPALPLLQAKQQLAQLMWLRQSEDLVLEALARLALLGEDLLRMLRT